MPTIDLSGMHLQATSPRIDALSANAARQDVTECRFLVPTGEAGGAPDVKFYRDFSDKTAGGNLALTPVAGEVGTFIKTSPNACVYVNDTDGFGAIAARADIKSGLTSVYFEYPDTGEFLIYSTEKTPNGWAFAGQINRETMPSSSVLKTSWPSDGDGYGSLVDEAMFTVVGKNFSVAGNTSNAGGVLKDFVQFDDYWNWNGWNDFSFYQREGYPDPISNNGFQHLMISSAITGPSKPTGTKVLSQSVPVHGTPIASGGASDVQAGDTGFNRTYIWSYFKDIEDALKNLPIPYKSNMLRRANYWATGSNSFQRIILLNAATVAASTRHWVKMFTFWGAFDSENDAIEFGLSNHERSVFTHAALLKPTGDYDIRPLASIKK
jgi:hypothetical protein